MGNICETMGITRKDPALGNQSVVGNSSSPASNSRNNTDDVENTGDIALSPKDCVQTDEIQSPVPAAAAKRKASEEPGFSAVNTTEIKLAFAKKQSDEAAAAAAVEVLTGPRLRLLPHQHTLFCERKQRVCQAVGQLQEMEVVKLEGTQPDCIFAWIRIKPEHIEKFSEDEENEVDLSPYYQEIHQAAPPSIPVEGERELSEWEYCLTREDVDHYLGVRLEVPHTVVGEDGAHTTHGVQHKYVTLLRHGVVKPGPPRLTDFDITGTMKVGTMAVAEISYIGGFEGPTEYWWMRISPEGKRTQVTEPMPIPYTNTHTNKSTSAGVSANTQASDVPAASSSPSPAPAEVVGGDGSSAVQEGDKEVSSSSSGEAAAVITDDGAATGAPAASVEQSPNATNTTETAAAEAEAESWAALLADPRYYLLTEADLGCCLKAKCRPTRSDGVQGEIFTSTSSEEVVA